MKALLFCDNVGGLLSRAGSLPFSLAIFAAHALDALPDAPANQPASACGLEQVGAPEYDEDQRASREVQHCLRIVSSIIESTPVCWDLAIGTRFR